MTDLKFCKDCRHFLYLGDKYGNLSRFSPTFCNARNNIFYDLVFGTSHYSNEPNEMRKSETLGCTSEGKWFESKLAITD